MSSGDGEFEEAKRDKSSKSLSRNDEKKRRKREKKQVVKTCIFCDGGDLSDEDFWPVWFQRRFPQPHARATHTVTTHIRNRDGSGNELRREPGLFHNRRSILLTRLKVVCTKCNNGWLSDIQNSAKETMTRIAQGKPVRLTPEIRTLISRWVTQFVMVTDFSDLGTVSISQAERHLFRQTLSPPRHWIISLGRMTDDSLSGELYHRGMNLKSSSGAQSDNQNQDHQQIYKAQSQTFVLGQMLFHVLCGDPSGRIPTVHEVLEKTKLFLVWPTEIRLPGEIPTGFTREEYMKIPDLMTEFVIEGKLT